MFSVLRVLQGLFRLAGSEARIRRLRKEFDECVRQTDLQQQEGSEANSGETGGASASAAHACNPHVLAGVVKRYLRELPEPLLCTTTLGNTWLSVAQSFGCADFNFMVTFVLGLHRYFIFVNSWLFQLNNKLLYV